LNDIGVIYRSKGNYHKALEYYFQALEGSSYSTVGSAYNNIAVIYRLQKEYSKALQFYVKAKEIFEAINLGQTGNICITNANIADVYLKLDRLQEAEESYFEALRIGRSENHSQVVLQCLTGLSHVNKRKGELEIALQFLNDSLELCNQEGFRRKLMSILLDLGDVYFEKKEYKKTEENYLQALKIAKNYTEDKEITCLHKLNLFYEKLENYKEAYTYFKMWTKLKDQRLAEEKEREMSRLQLKFETHEKEKEIESLRKENELKSQLLAKSEQLKIKNQELKEFSYAVSHDLKEPVRMISSFTQLLKGRVNKKLDNEESELFSYVTNSSVRLSKMIDDLYRYSTIGTGQLEKEELELNSLVDEVKQNLQLLISDTNASIETSTNLSFVGYRSLMVQLLQNLISNSIKFRQKSTAPIVEVSSISIGGFIFVKVRDNGVGINENNINQIFKLFKRGSASEEVEGSGIGLALCQKIANQLGGEIAYKKNEPTGSVFEIKIKKATT
jgi:signal transduction histidine kinase